MDFMRHGQSLFNVAFDKTGRDPGILDPSLTPLGAEQARCSAQTIPPLAYDFILCSPYTRALQTASIVAEVINLPLIADPLVGERRLYSCDIASPASALRVSWPKVDLSRVQDELWWPQDEESLPHLNERVRAFYENWGAARGNFLVVSHWNFILAATGVPADNAQIVKGT